MCDSGANPLGDQITLKLRHGAHDVEEKLTARSRGIHAFGVADEISAECPELLEAVHQMLYRAGETIEFPDQEIRWQGLVGSPCATPATSARRSAQERSVPTILFATKFMLNALAATKAYREITLVRSVKQKLILGLLRSLRR
jgi:hypothetical protein